MYTISNQHFERIRELLRILRDEHRGNTPKDTRIAYKCYMVLKTMNNKKGRVGHLG